MIDIKKDHIEQINEHAIKDYPYECCGIILGKFNGSEKTVTQILPIINDREDENKHNRYLIPSSKMLETELYAIKNGLDIVGFYHSHPDHPATPSAFDVEHALPVYSYEGKLRSFVNIYLNEEDVRHLDGLTTKVSEGDKVLLVPSIAGGK